MIRFFDTDPDNDMKPVVNIASYHIASPKLDVLKPVRAGIIPTWTDPSGRIWRCLGVDATHGELTDFGGGIRYKTDGTTLLGALRELREETLGVFQGALDLARVDPAPCLFSRHMALFFVPLRGDISRNDIDRRFEVARQTAARSEISRLVWLDERTFRNYLSGSQAPTHPPMYEKLYTFLRRAAPLVR